jgi:hypothetical protein
MASATTYHGDVMQFANGQTMGGAYRAPDPPVKIATLEIAFTAENAATTTFTDSSGAAKVVHAKASRSNQWQSQFPKPGRFPFPKRYVGSFSFESDITENEVHVHWTVVGTGFTLTPTSAPPGGTGILDYAQTDGTMQLELSGTTADCTESGRLNVDLPAGTIALSISTYGGYTVRLNILGELVDGLLTCPGPPATQIHVPVPYPGVTSKYSAAVNNHDADGNYQKGSIHDEWHEFPGPGTQAHGVIVLKAAYGP